MLAKPFIAIMPSNLCINPMRKWFYCHVRIFSQARCAKAVLLQFYPDLKSRPQSICTLPNTVTEKAMAPHSSILAWKIPWMEEPGGLQSMGLLRVPHD